VNETIEKLDGSTMFFVQTRSDEDAHNQLMMLTGQWLDMLDHVCRFHSKVITVDYLFDLHEDLMHMEMKYNWPPPDSE
jgi:hypothetical protein